MWETILLPKTKQTVTVAVGLAFVLACIWGWWLTKSDWTYLRTLEGQGGGVESVAFSPDGKTLAVAYTSGRIGLWNPNTGEIERVIQTQQNLQFAVFSSDGMALITFDLAFPR